ncbi:hypothetical protein [Paenibacillus wenxiniae]|uniref:Immunity protein 30 domain-containing protein n=1 Tax=Paenibacillus wenxiniae TaxID=1636843 RepID=A0ABW4RJL6_9BACL
MNLEEIEKLPDILNTETLEFLFQTVLNEFGSESITKKEFLLILSELADRQGMTYELLKSSIRKRIDEVLCTLWNTDSYEDVDLILSIVVNLGLESCFDIIKQSVSKNNKIDKVILDEILETINEVGDHISNPYYSMEKYK